jgi:hypothetical protein
MGASQSGLQWIETNRTGRDRLERVRTNGSESEMGKNG